MPVVEPRYRSILPNVNNAYVLGALAAPRAAHAASDGVHADFGTQLVNEASDGTCTIRRQVTQTA
jgi:hypothetical protein